MARFPTEANIASGRSTGAPATECNKRAHPAVEAHPAGEGVDEEVRPGRIPHQEVTGHPDPHEWDPTATCDLHEKDRDRDRDAEPAVEHLVEIRVPGVVVGTGVPPDAECLEHEVADPVHIDSPHLRREGIEPVELRTHIDGGVGMGGDQQSGLVEGDVVLLEAHEFSPFRRVVHADDCTRDDLAALCVAVS